MRILSSILFLPFVLCFTFVSCNQGGKNDIKYRQYLNEGKRLYNLHCSNCHQKDGEGLARLYPPLKNSDYLRENLVKVICGIKFGQSGEIMVNGILYNQPMPENPRLTNLEIAEIATYIYSRWGQRDQLITYHEVDSILNECGHKP